MLNLTYSLSDEVSIDFIALEFVIIFFIIVFQDIDTFTENNGRGTILNLNVSTESILTTV